MSGLAGLRVWRAAAATVLCAVAAACSSTQEVAPDVAERPPDAFGWVVDWEESPDYRFNMSDGVSAGSARATLEDGTAFTVVPSTAVDRGTCDPLSEWSRRYGPCWVHVGLSPDRVTAVWMRTFLVANWAPPEAGQTPVADRVYTIEPIAAEHDGRLVLEGGTVLPFDRSLVQVPCLGGTLTVDEAIDRFNHLGLLDIVVDQQTGVVTQIDCRLPE